MHLITRVGGMLTRFVAIWRELGRAYDCGSGRERVSQAYQIPAPTLCRGLLTIDRDGRVECSRRNRCPGRDAVHVTSQ